MRLAALKAHVRDEAGFTLSELIVVLMLLGVVMGGVYAGVQVAQGGNRIAEREARFEQEISTPMHTMDKWLSQNKRIEVATDYSLTFIGPKDEVTGVYRRYAYTTGTNKRLTQTIYRVNGSTGAQTLQSRATWSTDNVNMTSSSPLFTYLDANGAVIDDTTLTTQAARDQIKSLIIEVRAQHEGRTFSGRRQVFFRNR